MKRRSGDRKAGERYLLQFPGGVERLAEAVPATSGEAALRALPFEDPLPAHVLPGGEWLLEREERIVRDWTGAWWSVSATAAAWSPPSGEIPVSCVIEYTRYAPPGVLLSYRAASMDWPDQISDERLVAMLRRAWETMETDGAERRRRSNGMRSLVVEL
jgi:hypothetical protein